MDRYDLFEKTNGYDSWNVIELDENGEFVRHEDVKDFEAKAKAFDKIKAILERGMTESADVAWDRLESIVDVVYGVE
jgi:hypothetical protein